MENYKIGYEWNRMDMNGPNGMRDFKWKCVKQLVSVTSGCFIGFFQGLCACGMNAICCSRRLSRLEMSKTHRALSCMYALNIYIYIFNIKDDYRLHTSYAMMYCIYTNILYAIFFSLYILHTHALTHLETHTFLTT